VDIHTPHDLQSRNLTGDEPSYMLICQSIVLDRDVNLFNEASRDRKGRTFGCPSAGPHKARVDIPNGLVYSVHSPGLPMMLAPVFALAMKAGITPRYACAIFLNLLAAAGMLMLHAIARRFGATPVRAMMVSLAASFSMPFLVFSHQIYPDMPGAVVLLAGYSAVWLFPRETKASLLAGALAAGACAAWLPWLHIRFVILSAGLGFACFAAYRRNPGALAAAAIPVLVSAACLMVCYQRWYGSPWPNAAYIAQTGSAPLSPGFRSALKGLAGIVFDGGRGLLPWAPFWAFAPAGIIIAARRRPLETALIAVPAALYVWTIASFDAWWGGFCPPNRFMLVVIPMLAAATVAFLAVGGTARATVFAVLASAAAIFAFRGTWFDMRDFYAGRHILQVRPFLSSDLWYPMIAPDIRHLSRPGAITLAAWLAALVAINVLALLSAPRKTQERGR